MYYIPFSPWLHYKSFKRGNPNNEWKLWVGIRWHSLNWEFCFNITYWPFFAQPFIPGLFCPAFYCPVFFCPALRPKWAYFAKFLQAFEPETYCRLITEQAKLINISKWMIIVPRKQLNSIKHLNFINSIGLI